MENKGNIIVFTSTKCKVMNEVTRKVIARGYRNRDKLYVFEEQTSHKYEKDSDLKEESWCLLQSLILK